MEINRAYRLGEIVNPAAISTYFTKQRGVYFYCISIIFLFLMNKLFLSLVFLALLFVSCSPEKKEFGTDISTEASQITKGKQLFEQHCSSCHRFDQDAIGPNLSGLTRQVESSWIRAFIKNPGAVIANKDPRALALFEK